MCTHMHTHTHTLEGLLNSSVNQESNSKINCFYSPLVETELDQELSGNLSCVCKFVFFVCFRKEKNLVKWHIFVCFYAFFSSSPRSLAYS